MPPRPVRVDPTSLDDSFNDNDDDLFGGLEPFRLPPNLEAGRNVASGSGSRGALDTVGVPGISNEVDDSFMEDEMNWEEDERQDTLIPELIRHWTNERLAPDILDQHGELLQRVLARVREQANLVQQLRRDPEASQEEHSQIILVQTEAERVRFMVRSYMRTRIHKIEKYAHHILEHPDLQMRLSTMELKYAQSYAALIDAQFDTSVLNALPSWTRREGQSWHGPSTVSRPDKEVSVFAHALQDCDHVLLPNGQPIEVKKGSIDLFRYSTIENNLRRGEMDLV